MNPILPEKYYIPDVEARVFQDGRIYLYGSRDIPGEDIYCSPSYSVFATRNLVDFECREDAFNAAKSHLEGSRLLYAPDCVFIDGKYCLFYCTETGAEGVAFSDNPMGPFEDARPIFGADGDGIDPSVFVDDDGKVYYFWGQIESRGGQLDTKTWTVIPETVRRGILTEREHGFHEGSSIRKRNGTYYYVYADISRGRPTCLGYATSDHPLGPYTKRGILIDNQGCDPSSWNNHGCIAEIDEQWYVFYHRSTHNSFFSRHVCVEPIHFNPDGTIDEVEMTTQGAEAPILSRTELRACHICRFSGKGYLSAYSDAADTYQFVANMHSGDRYVLKYIDLTDRPQKVIIEATGLIWPYQIDLYIDKENAPFASVKIDVTKGKYDFQRFCGKLSSMPEGAHAVTLAVRGDEGVLGFLRSIRFE